MPGSADEAGAAEEKYRPLLFSIAYGMTGAVGDAVLCPAHRGRQQLAIYQQTEVGDVRAGRAELCLRVDGDDPGQRASDNSRVPCRRWPQ